MGYLLDTMTPADRRRPARRRQERAAPERREPAVRHGRRRARRDALSRRAIRTTGRSSATWRTSPPRATRTSSRSSRSTTRRRTRAWSSPATSTRRRRGSWSRSGSATSSRARRRSRSTIPGVALTGVQKKTITDRVQLPRLYLAWLTPRHFEPGDAALDVVADVLAGGKNSRLYKRLVYDMQIAQSVSAFQGSQALSSYFLIEATPRPGPHGRGAAEGHRRGDRQAAARGADRARGAAGAQPDRSVVLQPDGARRRLRRQGRSAERATTPSTGDPDWFNEDLARYRALSPSDIRAAADAFLPADRRVELTVVPENAETAGDDREATRAAHGTAMIETRCHACSSLCDRLRRRGRASLPRRRPTARKPPAAGPAAGAEAARHPEAAAAPTACPSGSSSCTRCRSCRSTSSS